MRNSISLENIKWYAFKVKISVMENFQCIEASYIENIDVFAFSYYDMCFCYVWVYTSQIKCLGRWDILFCHMNKQKICYNKLLYLLKKLSGFIKCDYYYNFSQNNHWTIAL